MKKIVFSDVTARDGLQSLSRILSEDQRISLIKQISKCNFKEIEVGSLVNPKVMPTMKNSIDVYKKTLNQNIYKSFLLAGNLKSIDIINKNKIKYFSIFTSPSDQFNKHNINSTVDESFERFKIMLDKLEDRNYHHIKGYISCIGECPYEGDVSIDKTINVIEKFKSLGVNEICLADTIGTLKPGKLNKLLNMSRTIFDHNLLSLHFHTENEMFNNTWKENLDVGISNQVLKFDTSILGIGGWPAAYSKKNKTGNLNIIHAIKYLKSKNYDLEEFNSDLVVNKIIEIENKWRDLLT